MVSRILGMGWLLGSNASNCGYAVKRCCSSAGSIPVRQLVVPAGSNRSGGGSNEAAGVFGERITFGDLASRQAVTRVNVEQASKRVMQEPTRSTIGEG